MIVRKGATDVTTYVMMVDSSTGAPETGLTITNFDLQYTRNQSTPAAKVDAVALAATNTAHTDNRAIEVDATSSPGLYRVDWPDAAFATGADKVTLAVTCTGCAPAVLIVELVDYNSQDGVRLGLTALPNAAADAAGGLPISDAGGLDLDAKVGALTFTVANKVDANATHLSGDSGAADNAEAFFDGTGYAGTNNVIPTVTTLTNKTDFSLSAAGVQAIWDAATSALTTIGSVGALVVALGSRLGSWTGTGVNTVLGAFKAALSKTATLPSDIGGTFDPAADSTEAIRDRGDAAYITATGFSTHSAADVWSSATRVLTAGTNIVLPANGLSNVTAWTVDFTGNLSGSVGSVTGAVGSVTGNVGGNVAGSVGSVSGNVGGDVTGLTAVYQAVILYIKDDAAAQDEWTVQWFKNGVPLASGITSPTLTVKNSSGTTIINAAAMTQIGSTGVYKYDATTTERVSAGIAMIATAAATIDAAARSFTLLKGRDTTA